MGQPPEGPSLNRRDLLKSAAGVGLASTLGPVAGAGNRPARPDLIRAENERPGTTDWLLDNARVDPQTKYRCPWVEGYGSHTSLRAGDALAVMVSTNPPSPFVLDVYRLGYYQGQGGRHRLRLGPFTGETQPDPPVGAERLRACRGAPAPRRSVPKEGHVQLVVVGPGVRR
jgi:hypothetical protein